MSGIGSMDDLKGRTVLISGASSGLGAHFARLAAAAGARVVIGARRRDRVEALAQELRAAGGEALAVPLDVTDEASLSAAFDEAEATFGLVDTVIANAGVSATGRSTDLSAATIRTLLDANVMGAMLTACEGARRMIAGGVRESGRGRVLLIGSITADLTGQGATIYAASKAAVAHLGRNLAREWVRMGVNVNVIQPGYIDTELAGEWFSSEGGKAQIAAFPRRRLQPINSLDPMVLYLCSDASLHMTGSVITLDDGQSA